MRHIGKAIAVVLFLSLLSGAVYWRRSVYPYYEIKQAVIYASVREIRVEKEGCIAESALDEGDFFQKGQVLFSLEGSLDLTAFKKIDQKILLAKELNDQTKLQLEQTMDQYLYLKKELGSDSLSEVMSEFLAEAQALQGQEEQSSHALTLLVDEKSALQEEFNKLLAIASFDGVVLRRLVQPGEIIKEGSSILSVCRRDLLIEAQVAETVISNIFLNQTADITLPSYPGKTWKGQVCWISPAVEGSKFKIRIKADDLPFKVGLQANVLIKIH